MKLTIASTAGFCFGVRNAIKQAEEAAAKTQETVYTFGPLIHNAQAIEDLEKKGIFAIEDMEHVPENAVVIIRAHGIPENEEFELKEKTMRLLDATCPYVKKIHRIVRKESLEGDRQIVIFGDAQHPEVKGICGWCLTAPIVYKNGEQILQDPPENKRLLIVEQTTFDRYRFEEMVHLLEEKGYDLVVKQTICEATMRHQEEAVEIASQSDVMIVLGGKNSSNTKKLVDLCKKHCDRTIFAETKEDLDLSTLEELREQDPEKEIKIGITAGASTPDYVIEQVAQHLS